MYVPLRVHGWHSLLTGVDSPARLLERAEELGMAALALTDVDTLAGSTDFLHAASGRALRPILGAELSDPAGGPGRLVALVRDEEGYRNLCRLVSARRLGDDPGEVGAKLDGPEGFDLVEAARRFGEGLTWLVDHPRLAFDLAGRIPAERLLVAISPAALGKRARGSPRGDPRETLAPPLADPKVPPPSRGAPAGDLVASARVLGLATVAVPDVYCADPRGFEHHRMRTAIKHNALACDLPEEWIAERPAHLVAPEELRRRFADLPDAPGPFSRGGARMPGALARTLEVAEGCRFVPPLGGVRFPEVELDEHETAYSKLVALAFDGACERYQPLRPEVVRRLDYELTAIDDLGYAPYFLLVRRIADFACERGIPHVGRGSAADSLVAYCLRLTDADPLRYDLPFERFLNPARRDRPDIDLDFCWRRRDEVLEHVGELFGAERTAMIATLNRFGLRAAFREAALAEGIPPAEVNRWSRRLPGLVPGAASNAAPFDGTGDGAASDDTTDERAGSGASLELSAGFPETTEGAEKSAPGWVGAVDGLSTTADERARHDRPPPSRRPPEAPSPRSLPPDLADNPVACSFRATPECRGFPFEDPRYRRVVRIAAALLDAPRHLGLHPGGVVVSPGPITDVVSCQRATKGVVMTQLDKDGVEAIGLVKMDLLGNRALSVIEDCRSMIAEGGEAPDLEAVAEDDSRTARLLARGGTLGCFQVESPGMRNLLKQTAARNMDDVIQAVALIRPGPAGSGMKDAYVRRFRGLEKPHPPHPRLTELLWDTHGVMLYQEDVMQAVVLMAGMELSEADELRRALAKHRRDVLERLRTQYFAGCREQGIERGPAAHVWELVSNFSSFGFCKAHAVTYGRIAYRTVWLKAHHPAEYLVAFLNSETGYYETRVYIEEARRLGVPILPPDVNRSEREFTLARETDPPALRVGLNRVKGLTQRTGEAILEERARRGAFLSLPDFLTRTGARIDEAERLIQCGAFDAFDRTRPEMLWRLHLLSTPARRPPRDLDPGLLASFRDTPEKRARRSADAAHARTGGWSRTGMGVGSLELEPGESASLFSEPRTPAAALPRLPETDANTRGRLELELLGLNVTDHPTELFPCEAEDRLARTRGRRPSPTVSCGDLDRHRGEQVSLRGWLAASRRVRTSDGRWMRFLSLEDPGGLAEVVLFADAYERHGHHLTNRGPFLVSGIVEDQMGACTLHADRIW